MTKCNNFIGKYFSSKFAQFFHIFYLKILLIIGQYAN